MVSLIQNPLYHPDTHARGSKCIDYIFGSTTLLQHVSAAGINSFYDLLFRNSDHRRLFIDIKGLPVLGANLSTVIPPTPRKLVSTSKTLITKFLTTLQQQHQIPKLLRNIEQLSKTNDWTGQHKRQLETIDEKCTSLLIQAEARCAIPVEFPWSPTLDKHSMIYTYWCIN
jgi:hypothetical protein